MGKSSGASRASRFICDEVHEWSRLFRVFFSQRDRSFTQAMVESEQERVADARAGRRALHPVAFTHRHVKNIAVQLDRLALGRRHEHAKACRDRITLA